MTHDLQNQIGAIDLNLQILPTILPENHPSADFVARAATASADLISALEDVQYFARAVSRDDDGEPVQLVKFDLSQKVRDTALELGSMAQVRKIQLRSMAGEEICAVGEADSVRRAIRMLAGEAVRASFPGSTIDLIVLDSPVPSVEISVSVEGVFEESRTTLATYVAKEILEASRVTVLLSSEPTRSRVQLLFQPV
jgi:signal transduction histidine kinase